MSYTDPYYQERKRRENAQALEQQGIISYQRQSRAERIGEFLQRHNGHNGVPSAGEQYRREELQRDLERPYGEERQSQLFPKPRPATRKEILDQIVVPNETSVPRKVGHLVKSGLKSAFYPDKTVVIANEKGFTTARIPHGATIISPYSQRQPLQFQPQQPQQYQQPYQPQYRPLQVQPQVRERDYRPAWLSKEVKYTLPSTKKFAFTTTKHGVERYAVSQNQLVATHPKGSRQLTKKPCKLCRKPFTVKPDQRNFCSVECHRKFNSRIPFW
jgi:hypothetical protein